MSQINDETRDIAAMRKKWKTNVIGDFEASPDLLKDHNIKAFVDRLSAQAKHIFEILDKRDNRTTLWIKPSTRTNNAHMTAQFKNLTILARAYGTISTDIYKDQTVLKEIVSGLDFMTTDGLYSGEKYSGNWWDWQIGVPQEFTTILMIIGDEIEKGKIEKYFNIMLRYLPDPYQQLQLINQDILVNTQFMPNFKNSIANRVDQAVSFLGLGLLIPNSNMIVTAVNSIQDIFKFVTHGDGFYEDGSFIEHYYIPYTGAYGNSLIKSVGGILSIIDDTQFQFQEAKINTYVSNVQDAFVPLVFNGETMSYVNGRFITRAPYSSKKGFGSETMYNLLITSEFANSHKKRELQQAAKYWMVQNLDNYFTYTRDLNDLLLFKKVLAEPTLDTTKPFLGSRVYGAMDRYVYSSHDIQVGISMYSNRISAFEAGNKENKKGWHLSDGMVYLYNSDQQFGDTYWPTVDWYRFPGTTVDTVALKDEISSFQPFKSTESFVGGVTDKTDAVISMQLNKEGFLNNGVKTAMNVRAKKTWFVFDGKIICLGSDINGTTDSTIETIVENRLLDAESTYKFIDSQGIDASTKKENVLEDYDWLFLKSSKLNQSIGYVMLDNKTIQTLREERTGAYREINEAYATATVYKGIYQKIIINHGDNVTNDRYAYMIYPNASETQLRTFAKIKPFEIVNNSNVQAVLVRDSQTFGATIWNKTGGSIEGLEINKSSTILYKQTKTKQITIAISDPKQTNEIIQIKLPQKITNVVKQDRGICVRDDHTILVDTNGGLGKSFQLTVNVE